MGDRSAIEWTDATWNPIVGCSVVSPGCTNCYAMRQAARIERMQPGSHYAGTVQPSKAGPVWTGKVALAPEHILTQPLRWRRPRRIFVNSMGDLFHESVPDEWIDRVFAVMALTPQHTYQVLTKRSARMRAYLAAADTPERAFSAAMRQVPVTRDISAVEKFAPGERPSSYFPWPLPGVWLGVSTEDQRRADERVPDLLATPAAIRFVSAEPLLGPLDLTRVGNLSSIRAAFPEVVAREERKRPRSGDGSVSGFQIEAVGSAQSSIEFFQTPDHMGGFSAASPRRFPRLDLVIAGGESGPNARPMHPDWARSLRDQCAAAGVAFFFKQWGEWLPGQNEVYPGFKDGRRVAHWQDGGWGPRAASRPDANYVTWAPDGTMHRGERKAGNYFEVAAWAQRIGKKAAGRLLDGVEHNAMPEERL
ncbi:MAG: hypothetical protein K0S00_4098 [Xanthobacteraceae bacterium]|jgi:protein gp37|nr:hypothetical protein [Xanthobacteraceae bacterium]